MAKAKSIIDELKATPPPPTGRPRWFQKLPPGQTQELELLVKAWRAGELATWNAMQIWRKWTERHGRPCDPKRFKDYLDGTTQ